MEIIMARGDLVSKQFTIRSPDKSEYTEPLDNIYFTVKKNFNDREYKFQKRLSDGGVVHVSGGKYRFMIMPEDTNGLAFGEYDFDIELVRIGSMKQTFPGVLKLCKEVTHSYNEGV